MRVVGFQEFCTLPNGTVYSHFMPNVPEGLYLRGDVLYAYDEYDANGGVGPKRPSDFYEMALHPEFNSDKQPKDDNPADFKPEKFANSWCRWACYDYDDLFVVYEKDDLQKFVAILQKTIAGTHPEKMV